MIHDDIRHTLQQESMGAVMGCRAAKSSVGLWQKRLSLAQDPNRKMLAQRMIQKFSKKVNKCKGRGMMI